jgi:hypothetical protein
LNQFIDLILFWISMDSLRPIGCFCSFIFLLDRGEGMKV